MKKTHRSVSHSCLSTAIAQRQCSSRRLILHWDGLASTPSDLSLFATACNHRFLHTIQPNAHARLCIQPFPTPWLRPLNETFPISSSTRTDTLLSTLLILTQNETRVLLQQNQIPPHEVGHSRIEYLFANQATTLELSTSFTYLSLENTTRYRLELRKGWNRFYQTLTHKGAKQQIVEYTSQAPYPLAHYRWHTERY